MKWRWYSKNNKGSLLDLINISISGARPANNPIILAIIKRNDMLIKTKWTYKVKFFCDRVVFL